MIKFILGFLFSAPILALLCIFFLSSCSSNVTEIYTEDGQTARYVKKKSSIHYDVTTIDNVFSLLFPHTLVRGADPKTFVALDYNIGKDKKWIYYRERKQKHVDYETFEVKDGIIRDKNFVYMGRYAENDLVIKEVINPEAFENGTIQTYAEKNNIYFTPETLEEQPLFDGKPVEVGFREYINKNLSYPKELAETDIQGRVLVEFIIETNGTVSNSNVVRGLDTLLDAEALRVINASPKWTPGKQKGETVRVKLTCPVLFTLKK